MGSFQPLVSVAIIGGGPGGLATAIALSKLPFLSVILYEQNPEPREIGAGISLGYNAWKILELLGAADGVKGASKANTCHRNGYDGDIIVRQLRPEGADGDHRGAIRARRTRLQSALLAQIRKGVIQYNKKLRSLENLETGGVQLFFQDQTQTVVDLVVGADGLRSAVRRTVFPNHQLHFTGNTAWRVLVPLSSVSHIPDITSSTAWWWGKEGYAYFSKVDDKAEVGDRIKDEMFEITVRTYHEPEIPGRTVLWGIPSDNERVQSRFKDLDQRIKDAIAVVPEGQWREFASFAGPCLENITAWDKVVLIGDASHPLSGAYGSGSAFAMEDGWILARALEHTRESSDPVRDALQIFEDIRGPYYKRMYEDLDRSKEKLQKLQLQAEHKNFVEAQKDRLAAIGPGSKTGALDWIYKNDIAKVWKRYLEEHGQETAANDQ